jgi:hypothetical protein
MTSPPRKMGRYEIVSEIGRGMMGIVYEATDPVLGRRLALKTIQVAFAISPAEREVFEKRFLTEARLAGALQHPNIVIVHDVGWDSETGTPWIAFELLKGEPLSDKVPPPLPWREAARIGARLADALAHAHAAGIVHRDIKPGNVMLLPNGEPKVMDFGIARAPASQLTAAGEFFGTPSYMSPEQAAGDELDGRSDLFSLGAVLYLLLTGERAFDAKSVPAILSKLEREDPAPPSSIVADIPKELDAIVARVLAKRPGDRYPGAAELADDLRDVCEGSAPRQLAALPPIKGQPTLLLRNANDEPTVRRIDRPPPRPQGPAPGLTSLLLRLGDSLGGRAALPVAAVLVLALALALGLQRSSPDAPASPAVGPGGASSPEGPAGQGEARPGAGAGAGEPQAAATPEPTPTPKPTPSPGRLTLEIEHSLKQGELQVVIDQRRVLVRELESQETKKALIFKGRKGRLLEVIDVSPGEHLVRVEVNQKGEPQRAAQIFGEFTSGGARLLEVRIGGQVTLEWR